jgi:hypothetical protein
LLKYQSSNCANECTFKSGHIQPRKNNKIVLPGGRRGGVRLSALAERIMRTLLVPGQEIEETGRGKSWSEENSSEIDLGQTHCSLYHSSEQII